MLLENISKSWPLTILALETENWQQTCGLCGHLVILMKKEGIYLLTAMVSRTLLMEVQSSKQFIHWFSLMRFLCLCWASQSWMQANFYACGSHFIPAFLISEDSGTVEHHWLMPLLPCFSDHTYKCSVCQLTSLFPPLYMIFMVNLFPTSIMMEALNTLAENIFPL